MKKFKILFFDGFDEVRDANTHDVIFSTKLDDIDVIEFTGRTTMIPSVVDNVVNIWNELGTAEGNLCSNGKLDEYLLYEGDCTQEEREIIVEALYEHSTKK